MTTVQEKLDEIAIELLERVELMPPDVKKQLAPIANRLRAELAEHGHAQTMLSPEHLAMPWETLAAALDRLRKAH